MRGVVLGIVAALGLAFGASAQTFPERPVTIVVPFPPGGSVDAVARLLQAELAASTGKTFVVDNRAGGAGGMVGSAQVQQSPPNGYTLLFNASIHAVTQLLNRNVPYDVVEDFTHVAMVASGPLLVTTPTSTKANSLKEFFEAMKAMPQAYNLATTGFGSAGHLAMEFMKRSAGVNAEVIAYKGGGPALNDLIGGHVQLLADPMASSLPHVKAGRLKALAVTTGTRSPLAPDVPTVGESGLAPFEMVSWYGIWAPKALDPAASAWLEKAIAAAVQSPVFKEKLAVLGFEPSYKNSTQLKSFVIEEMKASSQIIKDAKITIQ